MCSEWKVFSLNHSIGRVLCQNGRLISKRNSVINEHHPQALNDLTSWIFPAYATLSFSFLFFFKLGTFSIYWWVEINRFKRKPWRVMSSNLNLFIEGVVLNFMRFVFASIFRFSKFRATYFTVNVTNNMWHFNHGCPRKSLFDSLFISLILDARKPLSLSPLQSRGNWQI